MKTYQIREIQPSDNLEIAKVVREVLVEMGVPKVGTAYEDKALDDMEENYKAPRKKYYVVEEKGKIIGGAGIAPLKGEEESICELQKMYFLKEARGRGIGAEMIKKCMEFAQKQDFSQCYLETLPYMEHARKLYARTGFTALEKPLGDTGHYNCTLWMIRDLD